MTRRARKRKTRPGQGKQGQPASPAGRATAADLKVLTDGLGRYYLPVFVAQPDGTAVYAGMTVYDELEAAVRDTEAAPGT
ncbi:hypothetical protein [Amycolatopsis keratiniphila]|uniref:hypothetical protein n=1 Tax=Amycolatopsis keratiniphila TaxID=129921 RepID=UPI00087AF94F|nr:hypothetical protein [Amycolatopsis keratiniphila]OLZ43419.1 hypothetical protein BS330_42805 [Amycolatopsis keratiniphila subsp. nogabecina]SDU59577.1 hypothetical protein SAMN04489733_6715 [Amycolatopsis keratiniphila]SDU59619.1 hypothetical protein SAMN04489733_6723 [Amycolatopsis keratiniphila]